MPFTRQVHPLFVDRTVLTWVTFLAIIATRVADDATTLHLDPKLESEGNPLVTHFGVGVFGLILAEILVLSVALFLPLICFWRGRRPHFEQPPSDIWQFLSITFYRRLLPRRQLLRAWFLLGWPPQEDWFQVCRLWGIVISWGVIFGSFVAAASWWAIRSSPRYSNLYFTISFRDYPLLPLIATFAGMLFGLILYLSCEYSRRRREWAMNIGEKTEGG